MRRRWAWVIVAAVGTTTCGTPPPAPPAETTTSGPTTTGTPVTRGSSGAEAGPGAGTTTGSGVVDGTDSGGSGNATTGSSECPRNVVLMGYWPPTNEMLRPWSQNPRQNPGGWIGEDWGGYGFDVYSFFPEFPPDGDPSDNPIGSEGAVGSPRFDLRVDYQATSDDFWRLVDTYQPLILITTSRGGSIGWEIEALEGGHGSGNDGGPAFDWSSDQHGAVQFPTEESIEPRSWDAISTHRQGRTLPSQLPMDEIFAATDALGLTWVEIDGGTSGNFLSGFLGLHGLYYNLHAPHNVAAGHIHVGLNLPVADASVLIEQTLRVVLEQYAGRPLRCPEPR